jgi:transposase
VELLVERAAGLDVHKKTVVACARTPGEVDWHTDIRTFPTFTVGLEAMRDWLQEQRVEAVVLEATGVYWKPVWRILEGHFRLSLINPGHAKRVPGRKTDVSDAAWLAELCAYGLVPASFVPPVPIRRLRDLTRYRTRLVQMRSGQLQRAAKVLEDAGIKVDSVASTITTKSVRAMIDALCAGERDAEVLADLARARMRSKKAELALALEGFFSDHHAVLLRQVMARADDLDAAIAELDTRISNLVEPYTDVIGRLCTIPGIARTTAEIIIAETGADMRQFPTASHLASWCGLCPGTNESAGKNRSGATRPGNPWLRAALRQAATSAARTHSYLGSQHAQLMRRRGKAKAVVAVAHSLVVIAWHVMATDTVYEELGHDWLERRRDPARRTQQLVAQLQALGHTVTLAAAAN